MKAIRHIADAEFLRKLDIENLKTHHVRVDILGKGVLEGDSRRTTSIEGQVVGGSITIDGNSSIRRTGNINFVVDDEDNDSIKLTELLYINQLVQIWIGIENNIDDRYDNIIWFKQGNFYISQPTISHTVSGVNVSLQLKDKMCMLNGECGGGLPTSITFDTYDQTLGYKEIEYQGKLEDAMPAAPNNFTVYGFKKDNNVIYKMWNIEETWYDTDKSAIGQTVSIKQRFFDIIQTLVCNFGGEDINKIIINDVPLTIKSQVRYVGEGTLFHNPRTNRYTTNVDETLRNEWDAFEYNDNCGYIYTDFTYPGELISAIGDSVCSVLDKIKSALGNYEYFYDVDGNFVFQEIKNYLNTSYDATQTMIKYNVNEDLRIVDADNYYFVNFSAGGESVYTFDEGSTLISSYTNNPNYTAVKNDFHIWGENDDKSSVIHYHLAIKEKPLKENYDGGGKRYRERKVVNIPNTTKIRLAEAGEEGYTYIPQDWRAELYIRGLEKKALGQRPDVYEQELLDLFDNIYAFSDKVYYNSHTREYKYYSYDKENADASFTFVGYGHFISDEVKKPNNLKYWIDFINPAELRRISVDTVGRKIKSYQQSKINKLYDTLPPDVIIVKRDTSDAKDLQNKIQTIKRCEKEGQQYSQMATNLFNKLAIGVSGYSADEVARELIYQCTDEVSSISISSIPIYYLEPNTRITVNDKLSQINGDYVIKTINIPLDGKSVMSISATKVMLRF